jgi:tRNA A-37 threonylcarbamoyl transferase component Bud32
MPDARERLTHRGFDLRLENGFTADEARAVVDKVLATGGDRVSFLMSRPGSPDVPRGTRGRPPRLFVKAEFRRPDQPLSKRLRAARAVAEGRGYRAFAAAGIAVARLFAFGEQSRLRPRAGAVVVTEKIRGRDAARLWKRAPQVEIGLRVARTLARVHAAGLVHGDAVMRNFVLVPGAEYVIDLPGWGRFTAAHAERDLALFVGSAMKLGADSSHVLRFLDAYADDSARTAGRLGTGWRQRVLTEADSYRLHLVERDASRAGRRARKHSALARPGERAPPTDG